MAFGQSSGPPATARQMRELLELLEAAGHSDFRDARGPMGFNQRQAGGKFTGSEADEFIERLETEVHGDGPPAGTHPPSAQRAPEPPTSESTRTAAGGRRSNASPPPPMPLDEIPVEDLAAELQRRGWIVIEP